MLFFEPSRLDYVPPELTIHSWRVKSLFSLEAVPCRYQRMSRIQN